MPSVTVGSASKPAAHARRSKATMPKENVGMISLDHLTGALSSVDALFEQIREAMLETPESAKPLVWEKRRLHPPKVDILTNKHLRPVH